MEVDGDYIPDDDSMGEEEEYKPIDYSTYKGKKKKTNSKRATRNFVVDDDRNAVQYRKPSKKKRKVNNAPPNTTKHPTTSASTSASTSIINSMKQQKNYDVRATTKILPSRPKDAKKHKASSAKTPKHSRPKSISSIASTQQLIKQKTNQNSMHRNVPFTVQEKYLKQHYKTIEKLLLKSKQNASKAKGDTFEGIHHLKEAMGTDLNISSTSCNIIVEPGQKDSEPKKNKMTPFNETFVKRSTNYIQQRNHASLKNNKKGIDIDDYFSTSSGKDVQRTGATLNEKQRMELNQQRALKTLKQLGNTEIGANYDGAPVKEKKFSIKRRKKKLVHKVNKVNNNNHNHKSNNNNNNTNQHSMELNDSLSELHNEMIINTDTHSMEVDDPKEEMESNNGLNSSFDRLTNSDYLSSSDRTRVNLQKFELALKAAEDKSSAMDDESHQENCNVYVGGLHPECDESMLRKLFKHCGDIKQIRLDWRKKGFGFIHYKTHEQAMEAIEDMDGRLIMGQPIKCRWAKSKTQQLKLQQLQKEKEKEKETEGSTNDNTIDDINTNHPNPMYPQHNNNTHINNNNHMNNNKNNNNKNTEASNVTSIGFLSKRMHSKKVMNGPPALTKMKKQDDVVVEDNDEVEYW